MLWKAQTCLSAIVLLNLRQIATEVYDFHTSANWKMSDIEHVQQIKTCMHETCFTCKKQKTRCLPAATSIAYDLSILILPLYQGITQRCSYKSPCDICIERVVALERTLQETLIVIIAAKAADYRRYACSEPNRVKRKHKKAAACDRLLLDCTTRFVRNEIVGPIDNVL